MSHAWRKCIGFVLLMVVQMALALVVVAHADEAPDLMTMLEQGRYAEVEALAREQLAAAEAEHGPDSEEVAMALTPLVRSLWRQGRYRDPETIELAERAVRVKEQVFGADAAEVADGLMDLGILRFYRGDPEAARDAHTRALEILETAYGKDDIRIASCLNALANDLTRLGQPEEALGLFERALVLREKEGPEDRDIAMLLLNMAPIKEQLGDYRAALELSQRGSAMLERTLGPGHSIVARGYGVVARYLAALGDYPAAIEYRRRSVAGTLEALGEEHAEHGWEVLNLAQILVDIGEYAEALSLTERGYAIVLRALGEDNTLLAFAEYHRAEMQRALKDFDGAVAWQEKAVARRIKNLGPDNPDTLDAQEMLAVYQLDAGRREEGIALLRETLDGRRRAQGPQHPLTGRVMEQLGNALVENGQLAAGTSLIDEALTIRVAALGEQHHVIGNTLLRLGEAHAKAGSHDEALDDLNRALEVLRGAVGDEHHGVAEVHRARARLYRDTDQPGRALDEALRAEAIGRDHLRLTARALPETSALRYAEMRQSALSLAMSTAMKLGTDDALGRVWDAVIRSRAVVLDEMAARNRSLVQGGAETEILAEVVVAARARLARLMIQNLDEQENGRIADLMQEARNERNRAERALAAASAEFAAREARTGAGREQVVAGLPTDTSLLSFVRFEREGTGAPAYVAFVQGVDVGAPAAIDLGPAAPIESAIRAWREALIGVSRAEMRDRERGYRLVGERLRNLVWDPLVKSLGSATRVLIVPDGALHLVSFAALPIGKRRYLVESGPLLHYVSSERDILTRGADAPLGSGLLAVGGPAYDVKAATLSALRQGDTFRGRRSVCADFQLRRFQPLPQTRAEVDDIVRLWNDSAGDDLGRAVLRTGSSASEAAFKHEASGRRVLHLATHGFFLGDNCVGEGEPGTLLGSPLLGAGLAMAGANQRASAAADTEDGILTAEEIGALDLAGVEWTVLSACDTGVGEIRAGEGVLGLRRAFEVAGTRTLILSLWPVEDRSARLWMRELYRARLEDGKDVGDASRSASLALLERRRADGTGGHPAGWAAFVAAGAWR